MNGKENEKRWILLAWDLFIWELYFFHLARLVSDTAWLSSAINASTEWFTILKNQSGNWKLSIFISKTHLLHFPWILVVKDIIFNCFIYYTTVKYSSCYKELFFFYFMLLKNISFKHLAHTNKKGGKYRKR